MQRIYDFLKKCGTYYLATVDADGAPQVRPFGTIDIFDGRLCFQTGKLKPVSKQIHDNPQIAVSAFDGERWIRISAVAVEEPRIEAQVQMLDAFPALKSLYKAGDGVTEIFKLEHGIATICSFTDAPIEIEF